MELLFHQDLYDRDALEDTLESFMHLAKTESIRQENGYYKVNLVEIDPDVEGMLEDELKNYALHATIARRSA